MNTVQVLHSIRFDSWEYFKRHCLSFRRMDCKAQFSELFQKSIFSPIEELSVMEYKSLFLFYCHSGYCFSCKQHVSVNNEVLVNYINLEEILRSGTSLDQWPDFIIQNNTLTRIQCPHCATVCDVQTERIEKKLSDIMFIEFSMEMISISKFRSQIKLAGLNVWNALHFSSL